MTQEFRVNRNLDILIVDKDPDYFEVLKIAFRRNQINNPLHAVHDGQQAIDYLCAAGAFADRALHPFPSVIFTEIRLPRLSGFEILKWLRQHPQCSVIPVIVLSASDIEDDIHRAYSMGVNSYIIKPETLDQLQSIIRITFDYWAICAKPRVPDHC